MAENLSHSSSSMFNTLRILEVLSQSSDSLTITEISEQVDFPPTAVKRLCSMLEDSDYLTLRLDGRGFLPGPRLAQMANNLFSLSPQWRNKRQAILSRLSTDLGETCNICIPHGISMRYFDRVETQWPLRIKFDIDDRVPLYCTSTGKLYLSSLPEPVCNRLLKKISFLPQTHNTITTIEDLKQELDKIRKEGLSIDNQEFMQGMICVAVPLLSSGGKFFAALAMHAPTSRLSLGDVSKVVPLLLRASEELTATIDM